VAVPPLGFERSHSVTLHGPSVFVVQVDVPGVVPLAPSTFTNVAIALYVANV
jgi:hypothetical protein